MVGVKGRPFRPESFDDAEIVLTGEVGHGISGLTARVRDREVIEAPIDHLDTDPIQGELLDVGDLITQINEDGIEEESSPDLKLDPVDGTGPEIAQVEQTLDKGEGLFNSPASPVQIGHVSGREDGGIEHIGQIVVPASTHPDLDQAQGGVTGIGAILPQLDEPITHVVGVLQRLGDDKGGIAAGAGDKGDRMVGEPIEQGKAVEATIQEEQGVRRDQRLESIEEVTLIEGGLRIPDEVHGQFRGQIEDAQQVPTMGEARLVPQRSHLGEEGLQLRGIDDPQLTEVLLGPPNGGRQRTGPSFRPFLQGGQDGLDHRPEEGSWQDPQAQREGLLADLARRGPQKLLPRQQLDQGRDTGDLAPDQREDERHHDRQAEDALAQAQAVVLVHDGIGGRLDQVGQMLLEDGVKRGGLGSGTGVIAAHNGAGFAFRQGG